MTLVIWIVAGGLLGWASYRFWGFNAGRGVLVSIVIGAAGGLVGGDWVAPVFLSPAAIPGNFDSPALLFAVTFAVTFLFAGSRIHDRWGV